MQILIDPVSSEPENYRLTPTRNHRFGKDTKALLQVLSRVSNPYLHDSLADGHISRRKVYDGWLALPFGSSLM